VTGSKNGVLGGDITTHTLHCRRDTIDHGSMTRSTAGNFLTFTGRSPIYR